jgi:hypothetical protein
VKASAAALIELNVPLSIALIANRRAALLFNQILSLLRRPTAESLSNGLSTEPKYNCNTA